MDNKKASKKQTGCDPLFKETVNVITENGGRGLSEWVATKQLEDDRMNGNARPKTRSQSKN